MRQAAGDKTLKVILESGELRPQSIKTAARVAIEEGADFIKTSTGKSEMGATVEAANIMCQEIANWYQETGKKVGFKPSGGIRTFDDAMEYYNVVKEVLGEQWLNPGLFRIGASSLYDNLNQDLSRL